MKKLILTFICLLFAIPSQAATITVDDDGPADFNNIQAAIDVAVTGDTVLVADGAYTGPGNRDIDFHGKAITVRSQSGPENCIIDCNGTWGDEHRGFYFNSYEDTNYILDGFTITNGFHYYGSAICCDSSSPTINNCIIYGNSTVYGLAGGGICCMSVPVGESSPNITNCTIRANNGGGIYCQDSSPTITNCTIIGNTARSGLLPGTGAGIQCSRSRPTIANCEIRDNSVHDGWDGAISCIRGSLLTIANSTISGNKTSAIFSQDSSLIINNCTITGNKARYGGGIDGFDSTTTITNCIIRDNSPQQITGSASVTYSDVQDGWPGQGNIDKDPCFIEPGYWVDANDPNIIVEPNDPNAVWLEGDYHLLPDSPCIDTGDPNYIPEPNETDLDGKPRVSGTRIDMGAYESNYIKAEMNFTPKTINCSSKGNWIKAHLTLPDEFLPEDVDANKPAWAEPIDLVSEYIKLIGSNPVKLEIAFDRQAFCARLTEPGQLEITIIGSLTTGQNFHATDAIKVIDKGRKEK